MVLKKNSNKEEDNHRLNELQRNVTDSLERMSNNLERRLNENVHAMNESKSFLATRVHQTERTVREVSSSLGKLENATSALKNSTEEILDFQQLLKSPKIRGGFGEVLLSNLLKDVLPSDRYLIQYTMPGSGEIADAVIKLQDGYIVAADAKFPLSNFETYAKERDENIKSKLRTALMRDLKKHVLDISKKYISPQDKTLDYAFMYIPVESIYYETMVHQTDGDVLWEFCLKNKIVPVSPNSFLAYLQTVLIGLRGMKIQQQAREIMASISQFRIDFKKFNDDFSMVGKHINNAKNRYENSIRRLDRFSNRLEQLEVNNDPKKLPAADRTDKV